MKYQITLTFLTILVSASSVSPDGYTYIGGGQLKFHDPTSWEKAVITCFGEGATLASPLDEGFTKALKAVMLNNKVSSVYTGIHDYYTSGLFYSLEGIPIAEIPLEWAPGQPTVSEDRCILLQSDGKVRMQRCSEAKHYICYKSHKEPIKNECDTPYPGYKLDLRTGSCYKHHLARAVWPAAFRTCAEEGAHLAVINSLEEAHVLYEFMKKSDLSNPSIAIGFAAIGEYPHGNWLTIQGQSLPAAGYGLWAPGEPSNWLNIAGRELCGTIIRGNVSVGVLNDAPCDFRLEFVCEKKPKPQTFSTTEMPNHDFLDLLTDRQQ